MKTSKRMHVSIIESCLSNGKGHRVQGSSEA